MMLNSVIYVPFSDNVIQFGCDGEDLGAFYEKSVDIVIE